MATLTDAASFSKRAFNFSIIGTGVLVGIIVLVFLVRTVGRAIFPPKPPPATVAFGKLARLDLSEGIRASAGVNYAIETIKGDLPILSANAKVFVVSGDSVSFGATERAKIIASKVGFSKEPSEISGNLVRFVDPGNENRTLTIELGSGNFNLESNYLSDQDVISTRPRSLEDAVNKATNFLAALELQLDEFPKEKLQTKTFRIDGQNKTETPALSSANLVRVNLHRADIDKLPVINPLEKEAGAYALVWKEGIAQAAMTKVNIARNQFATYPLKGTLLAFEDLKEGRGALNKSLPPGATFAIRDVTLGYLETKKYQQYLQPVYIFKGDSGLVAYVAAVDDQWLKD